jgi:hypothetical protein
LQDRSSYFNFLTSRSFLEVCKPMHKTFRPVRNFILRIWKSSAPKRTGFTACTACCNFENYCFSFCKVYLFLTLILLTWRIWWAHNNANKWQMGFNLVFKGLILLQWTAAFSDRFLSFLGAIDRKYYWYEVHIKFHKVVWLNFKAEVTSN